MHVVRAGFVAGLIAVTLAWPQLAAAQGVDGTRSVYFSIGTGVGLSGNVIQEATGSIDNVPGVFVEQAFSNHYSDGLKIRGGFAYGFDYNKEVFGTFGYGKLNATERVVGSIGGYPLYARFSNARTLDFEGGVRYYFLADGPLRTYVGGVAGLRFLDEINTTLRVLELGLTIPDVEYFDSSALFMFGGDAGITRDLSENVAIGGELGLRFQPKPGPRPILSGTGFEDINDTGSRWSIPINVFVAYKF
jgi:hypothetical protein